MILWLVGLSTHRLRKSTELTQSLHDRRHLDRGTPQFPWTVPDTHLRPGQTRLLRSRVELGVDQEPIAGKPYPIEERTAKELEGTVDIAHPQSEYPTLNSVVDPRCHEPNPPILATNSETGHHVEIGQLGIEIHDVMQIELRIGVGVEDRLVAAFGETANQRLAVPGILLLSYDPNAGLLGGPTLQNLGRPVGGAIIDDDQLPGLAEILKSRNMLHLGESAFSGDILDNTKIDRHHLQRIVHVLHYENALTRGRQVFAKLLVATNPWLVNLEMGAQVIDLNDADVIFLDNTPMCEHSTW